MANICEHQKIFITGGDGFVGSNLLLTFATSAKVYPSVVKSKGLKNEIILDITDRKSVQKVISKLNPNVIIHTAGLSSLAACEKDPSLADKINYQGTKNIVLALKNKSKTKLIFFSSDYVFDGQKGDYAENDPAKPKTVYGQTKKIAEDYIKANLKNYIILRTANIFGRGGNFFQFVVDSLTKKEKIEVYGDVKFTPTYIDYLTGAIKELVEKDFIGTIHLTGREKVSRYQFAQIIARTLGKDQKLIRRAAQPKDGLISKDSSLNTDLASKTINLDNPGIEKAIHYSVGDLIMPYFQFKDNRGSIEGVFQGRKWSEINYFESTKDVIRGNHYHKETTEGFLIVEGKIQVTLKNIKSSTIRKFLVTKGDIFIIEPYTLHIFEVVADSKWINMLTKTMDGIAPDIHKV
jgi:dTDP-4-dehydrorhamnose reductase